MLGQKKHEDTRYIDVYIVGSEESMGTLDILICWLLDKYKAWGTKYVDVSLVGPEESIGTADK